MMLFEAIDAYILYRRALGAVFKSDARILRALGRALGDIPLERIEAQRVHEFCRGSGPPTRWWTRKDSTVRMFCNWLVQRGHLDIMLLPDQRPKVNSAFQPYIYSRAELVDLLDSTAILQDSRWPLKHRTYRTLLLLLYAAGLRAGEGLRLQYRDVDLDEKVILIRDSKFFKSRLIPIGSGLAQALNTYRDDYERVLTRTGKDTFFAADDGGAISYEVLRRVFTKLRRHAGIPASEQPTQRPRLHDLRHSFAVHKLVEWYRQGEDAQALLPLLSTYLGHSKISSTQCYLSMTPELLEQASVRFERYADIHHEEELHHV